MKSLRTQLLLGVTLGTTAILLGSCALLYTLIRQTLESEFNEALAAKARAIATLAERDASGLDFEPIETSLPEFADKTSPEYYEILEPDGTPVLSSPSLKKLRLDHARPTPDSPAFKEIQLPDGRAGRTVALSFVPRQEYDVAPAQRDEALIMVVGRDTAPLRNTLARMGSVLIAVGIGSVLLSAAVLAWVVERSLRPLQQLSHQIAAVGEKQLSKPLANQGVPLEMTPVVDRLNDLLARLDAAFQRERRFTGDVAHELRTPIAGLRAKLELALSRERPVETYRSTMNDCLQINHQMQSMVENLLHLARADAGQVEVRREPVDLPELFRECWKPLEAKAKRRSLNVDWSLDGVSMVETDRDKLQLVVRNVLDNAVSHTLDQGRVTVAASQENGHVGLTVSNTTTPLAHEQIKHVFDRFWRGDSSYRPGETHCGLGLPLCKALIEQLGGTISADTKRDPFFTLTIRLPR